MPPAAMPSSVVVTIVRACGPGRRSRNSSVEAGGNLGARPKPPKAGSKVRAMPFSASSSSSAVSGSVDGWMRAELPTDSTRRRAWAVSSSRCSRHAWATASSTWVNEGSPWRGSGGK